MMGWGIMHLAVEPKRNLGFGGIFLLVEALLAQAVDAIAAAGQVEGSGV